MEAHTNALLATQDAIRGHMTSARARWSHASESGSGRHAIVWESGVFIALLSGDLPTVNARARRAELDLPRRLSPPWVPLFSAIADAEQGRIAQARASVDRIAREYEGDDLDLFSQYRRWAEGLVAWAEGRLTTAVAILQRAVDRCSGAGAVALTGLILSDLAEVAAAAGDTSGAAQAAAAAEDLAQHVGAPSFQAFHRFASAWSLLAQGRPDDAATEARHAADALRAVGYPLLEARAASPTPGRSAPTVSVPSPRWTEPSPRSRATAPPCAPDAPAACCPRSARARTMSPRCWASRH